MTEKNIQNSWKITLVPIGSSMQQAIHSLEASGMQIVLVVSGSNELIGTITDGDIRRAFLRGAKLNDSIEQVINRTPLVAPPDVDRNLILKIMQANKIFQVPAVNHDGKVLGLYMWDSVISVEPNENIMVIMAGGLGTRMSSYTENCPKPMLEVRGKPMLEHIIERAREEGFNNFLISVNYLRHIIEDYFGDGQKWKVNIEYLRETLPLGTAGSLSLIKNRPTTSFIVINGDVLTDIRYGDILKYHSRNNSIATMAVRQYEIQNQFGVVRTNGIDIAGFEEKPVYQSHINAGIYVLDPKVLDELEEGGHCDMPTLFQKLRMKNKRTIAFPMHEPWLDIGNPTDLKLANEKGE